MSASATPTSAHGVTARGEIVLSDLVAVAGQAAIAAEQIGAKAAALMKVRLSQGGRISAALLEIGRAHV